MDKYRSTRLRADCAAVAGLVLLAGGVVVASERRISSDPARGAIEAGDEVSKAVEPPNRIQVLPFDIAFVLIRHSGGKSVYMAETEVSQKDFRQACGFNPSDVVEENLPVTMVNWYAANYFCTVVGGRSHAQVRLPTRSEWNYAFGDPSAVNPDQYLSAENDGTLHATGSLKPNSFGLFDMVGNVSEMCYDGDDAAQTVLWEDSVAICGDSYQIKIRSAHVLGKNRTGSAIAATNFVGFRPVMIRDD